MKSLFSLAVMLCLSLLFSCAPDIEPIPEIPNSSETSSSVKPSSGTYCLDYDWQECTLSNGKACPDWSTPSNSCPSEWNSSSSSKPSSSSIKLSSGSVTYCLDYDWQECTLSNGKACPDWSTPSNSCPSEWNSSSSSKPSSSSVKPSSSSMRVSSSSVPIPISSSAKNEISSSSYFSSNSNSYIVCDTIPSRAGEGDSLTINCPFGIIDSITFASYGTATGSCGNFAIGECHATNSLSVVSSACLGKSSCTVFSHNDTFGDPCDGTPKSLYVQAVCSSLNSVIFGF